MYKTKKGKPQVVWILKKSVTIPQRRFMYMDDEDLKKIRGYFKEIIYESDT